MTAEPCALLAIGALGALSDLGTAVLAELIAAAILAVIIGWWRRRA